MRPDFSACLFRDDYEFIFNNSCDEVQLHEMPIEIIKSSGKRAEFKREKLVQSLIRSGAPSEIAYEIAKKVEKQIKPLMKTKSIYGLAKKYLKRFNRASGMRYSLKKALFALGPTGYPFEKYFARILKQYEYSVHVGKIIDGYCVKHEVDIMAARGGEHFIIECKYHSSGGLATDVKTALYVHSRFLDIKKARELLPENASSVHEGWLVTNTRCTTDALQFAECTGLKIVSWRYPSNGSLEKMIEEKRLYPVTILQSAKKNHVQELFKNDIILAQDIADMDEETFVRRSGLDMNSALTLKNQADEICPCIQP